MSFVGNRTPLLSWIVIIALLVSLGAVCYSAAISSQKAWEIESNPITYTKQGVITDIDTTNENTVLYFEDGSTLTVIGKRLDIPLNKEVVISYKKDDLGEVHLVEVKVYE